MSMINKEIADFKAHAFHENDFKSVSKEDILGKWSVFVCKILKLCGTYKGKIRRIEEKYAPLAENKIGRAHV